MIVRYINVHLLLLLHIYIVKETTYTTGLFSGMISCFVNCVILGMGDFCNKDRANMLLTKHLSTQTNRRQLMVFKLFRTLKYTL